MENKHDGCSGCHTKNWCCNQKYRLPKSDCPCYGCLIKVMCLIGCKNYNDWMIKVEHNTKHKRALYDKQNKS